MRDIKTIPRSEIIEISNKQDEKLLEEDE